MSFTFTEEDFAPKSKFDFTEDDFAPQQPVSGPPEDAFTSFVKSKGGPVGLKQYMLQQPTAGTAEPLLTLLTKPLVLVPHASQETIKKFLTVPKIEGDLETIVQTPEGPSAVVQRQPEIKQAAPSPKSVAIAAGVTHAGADMASFFTSPLGIATLGIGALPATAQRVIALGFAAQMAKDVPEIAKQLGEELGKPEDQRDYEKISKLSTEAIANTAFVASGVKHGLAEPISAKLGALPSERPPIAPGQVAEQSFKEQPVTETVTKPKETTDALGQQISTPVHADVLPQSIEGEGKVPAEKGVEGIPAPEEKEKAVTPESVSKMTPDQFNAFAGTNPTGKGYELAASLGTESDRGPLESGEKAAVEELSSAMSRMKEAAPEERTKLFNEAQIVNGKKQYFNEALRMLSAMDDVKSGKAVAAVARERGVAEEALADAVKKQETELGTVESRGSLGGNVSAFGLFDPANYEPAVRAAAEATHKAADAAGRKLEVTRKAFGNIAQSFGNRHAMDQTLDAADNIANIIGQRQGNNVKIGIKPEQDEAASVLVASGFDKAKAQDFLAKAQKGGNKSVEKIVDYALKNWDSIVPIARRGQAAFERQLRQERAAGIETERHEDYLPGVYDMDLMMGVNRPFVIGAQRISGVGTGFKKGKVFATPFDAVEAGYSPRSLKLSDLVENRVRSGQRLITRRAWGDSLKSIIDPTTKTPIAENLILRKRPNGTSYEVAPPGYVARELLPGVRMAIHETYSKLFDALTGNTSAIREFEVGGVPVGQLTLQGVGGIKHGTLLLDTYHMMRVFKKQLFSTGKLGYGKGLSILEYSPKDLQRAVKEGEITQDMADYAMANRDTAGLLLKNGLNVGRVQQAMYTALVRKIPIIGGFNKWVFEKLTRGAMMEAGISEFERVKKNNPSLSDTEVARQVSRDLNKYFGNLQRQGVFKSQTMLDLSALAGFAPQWIESQVRSELGGAKQLVADPILKRQLSTGTLGSAMARGFVAYIAATQIVNLATRKQFTWQNDEKDHKLDAWIPDVTGKTGGYWLSPLSGAAENTKDVIDAVRDEPDALSAAGRIMANKSGSLVRAGKILLQGRDWRDQKIIGSWNKMKQASIQLAPVPIPLSTTIKGGPPGSTQRQIMQSFGEKVKPVKTANQDIGEMARKWGLASDDPKVKFQFQQQAQMQYGDSAFKPVRDAIHEQNDQKIVDAVQTILDREPTEEAAGKRLTQMLEDLSPFTKSGTVKHIATNSKANEKKFLESLDDRGKQIWLNAIKERVRDYRRLTKAIYGRQIEPNIPPEYRQAFAE